MVFLSTFQRGHKLHVYGLALFFREPSLIALKPRRVLSRQGQCGGAGLAATGAASRFLGRRAALPPASPAVSMPHDPLKLE